MVAVTAKFASMKKSAGATISHLNIFSGDRSDDTAFMWQKRTELELIVKTSISQKIPPDSIEIDKSSAISQNWPDSTIFGMSS
jgi:hypothetical protein